jgi:hypothetical protein
MSVILEQAPHARYCLDRLGRNPHVAEAVVRRAAQSEALSFGML